MSKFKKFLLAALAVCAAVSSTAAIAACTETDYPDFRNPIIDTPPPGGEVGSVLHTVNVSSSGGLPLGNVQVSVVKDGKTVVSGISKNGKIEAYLLPGEYELKVDEESLPLGYYLPDDADFKIEAPSEDENADKNYTGTVKLPSRVIPTAADSTKRYGNGDVMHDFGFTASDGERRTLSQLLETKKAVVLNFWYINCKYCNEEFPDLQNAYNSYKDVLEVVALDNQDSAAAIQGYQEKNGYTFPMARDAAGITSRFDVQGFPTTVIIDRYGVVAFRTSGAINESTWRALFAKYSSDSYTQDITVIPPDGDGDITYDWKKPDIAIPDHSQYISLLGDSFSDKITSITPEVNEEDAPNSWPWAVTDDGDITCLSATNTGADPSFATVYISLQLKKGDIVSYDYNFVNNDRYDMLYVILNSNNRNSALRKYSGSSDGWRTEEAAYTAPRDESITLAFMFYKTYDSEKETSAENFGKIANIRVVNVEDMLKPIDFALAAYDENITEDNIVLGDDGFYRIQNTGRDYLDGNLLLVELWQATPWSKNHTGSDYFTTEGSVMEYPASMYYLSFWEHSDHEENDEGLTYSYLTVKESDFLNEMLNLQNFSESKYLPVTEQLRTILEKFCLMFSTDDRYTGTYTQSEWLEMCYVYRHYNGAHKNGFCSATDDPVKGMTRYNALTASETTPNHVNVKTIYSHTGGGIYFRYTPSRPGVYRLRSTTRPNAATPEMFVIDSRGKYDTLIAADLSYDAIGKPATFNGFYGYYYFDSTEATYYLQARLDSQTATGEFDFVIEYVGESFDWLRVCSTADGMFIGIGDNFEGGTVYGAIPWAWNPAENCYYSYFNNEFGSKIYIDFIHPNYYDSNDHSLYEMIKSGYFNLNGSPYFSNNYTTDMLEYYEKAIEGKDKNDPLYGMLEADDKLVSMIAEVFELRGGEGDGLDSGYWLSVACYYHHFGS